MAAHSSVLAWRVPGTGESGGLPSLGLHRVGHDWSDLAAAAAAAAVKNQGSRVYVSFWVEVVKCWEIFPDSILLIPGAPCEQDEFTRFPESGFQDHLGGNHPTKSTLNGLDQKLERELGDLCSIPGLGRSPGEGNGHPLQYSGLENPMDCSMGSQRDGHD